MNPIAVSLFFALLLLWTQLILYRTSKQQTICICFIGMFCYYLLYINTEKTGFVVFVIGYSLMILLFLKKYFLRSLLSILLVGLIVACAYKKPTALLRRVQSFAHSQYNTILAVLKPQYNACKLNYSKVIQLFRQKFMRQKICSLKQSLIYHLYNYMDVKLFKQSSPHPQLNYIHLDCWGISFDASKQFDASSSERLKMAHQCLILIKQKPLMGHGTHSFRASLMCEYHQPHNEWLHICVQWGLLGIIAFTYWFGYSFYYGWKHRCSFYGQALITLNGAYLIAGCCDSVFFSASYRFTYIFLFCAIVAKLAEKELKEVKQ
jgi:O-antigen ligase